MEKLDLRPLKKNNSADTSCKNQPALASAIAHEPARLNCDAEFSQYQTAEDERPTAQCGNTIIPPSICPDVFTIVWAKNSYPSRRQIQPFPTRVQ